MRHIGFGNWLRRCAVAGLGLALLLPATAGLAEKTVAKVFTVTLYANGGIFPADWPNEAGETRALEYTAYTDGGCSFVNVGITPEREGMHLLGFSRSPGAKAAEYYEVSLQDTSTSPPNTRYLPIDGSVNALYAVWTKSYWITFNANGGSFGTDTDRYGRTTDIETLEREFWYWNEGGSKGHVVFPNPSKDGDEVFKGWSASATAKKPDYNEYLDDLELNSATPKVLYAVYGAEGDTSSDYEPPQEPVSIADLPVEDVADVTWTGKALKPKVRIGASYFTEGEDYKLVYANNKNVGLATVRVVGIGLYTDYVEKTFRINPKGTALDALTAKKKSAVVAWKPVTKKMSAAKITGYEIQYSTRSAFKSASKVTVKGASKKKTTVKNLKSGKKYYFRIRTYMKVKDKTYYSEWSKPQSVKVG